MNRLHGGILSLLACVLVVSVSGCMIGPTNRENIGSIENKIAPGGFVLEGDMLIEVQSWNFEMERWETVATTFHVQRVESRAAQRHVPGCLRNGTLPLWGPDLHSIAACRPLLLAATIWSECDRFFVTYIRCRDKTTR